MSAAVSQLGEGAETAVTQNDAPVFWLVGLCVGFNFLLSVANAHGVSVSGTHVQVIQLALTGAAALLVWIRGVGPTPFAFVALIGIFLLGCLTTVLATGAKDYKTIYDVMLFCIFIALGNTLRYVPVSFLHAMLTLVAAISALELLLPGFYTELANPLSYFANTRAWVAEALADTFTQGAGLAIGTIRGGGESWLGIATGGHRIGGIFLEPLSQGYFSVILSIFYFYYYRNAFLPRTLACIACLALALISDTRIAVLLITFAYLTTPFLRLLPEFVALAIPIVGMVAGVLIFSSVSIGGPSSELLFRLSLTFHTIQETPFYNTLFGGLDLTTAADSGIVTILSQSGMIGLISFLVVGSGYASMQRRDPQLLILLMIYVFATALFGAAFLSIKTASLLGLMIGASGSGAFAPQVKVLT